MERRVLTFHNWRASKPDDDHEHILWFLFSLVDEVDHKAGIQPDHKQTFWTEVSLSRDLASRGRWKELSKADKHKAMFQHAWESVRAAGRMLREAPLFWRPGNPLEEGPPWDLSKIHFPKPQAEVIDVTADTIAGPVAARKGAGLSVYAPPQADGP